MPASNALSRAVSQIQKLPAPLRGRAITLVFNSQVRFAGTGKVRFESLTHERAVLHLPNHAKVRNHIGGVHAAAMALLAETATGSVFGMNSGATQRADELAATDPVNRSQLGRRLELDARSRPEISP